MYADAYDGFLPWYGGWDPNYPPPYYNKYPSDERHPYVVYRANPQWCENGDITKPYPMKLGCLYAAGIITKPKIFYCPANQDPFYRYESYTNPSPWGTLPQKFNARIGANQWVRTGYDYYPTEPNFSKFSADYDCGSCGPAYAPKWTARRFDRLDARMPYITDVIYYGETISHKTESGGYSLNALFKDGHVVYCEDQSLFSDKCWLQWERKAIKFNCFYYNFFKKIGP